MAVQVSGVIPMLCVLFLICLSVVVTWCVSYCLTKTIYKNDNEIFALELPEYRKPEIAKTLIISLCKPNCQNCRQSFIGISSDRRTGLAYGKYTN